MLMLSLLIKIGSDTEYTQEQFIKKEWDNDTKLENLSNIYHLNITT